MAGRAAPSAQGSPASDPKPTKDIILPLASQAWPVFFRRRQWDQGIDILHQPGVPSLAGNTVWTVVQRLLLLDRHGCSLHRTDFRGQLAWVRHAFRRIRDSASSSPGGEEGLDHASDRAPSRWREIQIHGFNLVCNSRGHGSLGRLLFDTRGSDQASGTTGEFRFLGRDARRDPDGDLSAPDAEGDHPVLWRLQEMAQDVLRWAIVDESRRRRILQRHSGRVAGEDHDSSWPVHQGPKPPRVRADGGAMGIR